MQQYQAYPQRPDEIATPFKQPDHIDLIASAESILTGAYGKPGALRDTCRDFLGWEVPRSKPKPPGDVSYCTGCHEWKAYRDFGPDDRKRNGLQSRCKQCEKGRQKRLRLRAALAESNRTVISVHNAQLCYNKESIR